MGSVGGFYGFGLWKMKFLNIPLILLGLFSWEDACQQHTVQFKSQDLFFIVSIRAQGALQTKRQTFVINFMNLTNKVCHISIGCT
jgi:hypothetical protein